MLIGPATHIGVDAYTMSFVPGTMLDYPLNIAETEFTRKHITNYAKRAVTDFMAPMSTNGVTPTRCNAPLVALE